jgi:hypothetical protein
LSGPDRSSLIALLSEAAALEHSLCCQYLFAAFSLKQGTDEGLSEEQLTNVVGWERLVLSVARQEMEHLGLAGNLLTAIGGAPTLEHPVFPYGTHLFGGAMALEPFSPATVQKFVCFERPEHIQPADAFCQASPPAPAGVAYTTVGELYGHIRTLLQEVAAGPEPLFIGPAGAQVAGGVLGTDFPRVGAMGGGYDVYMRAVTDLPSALAAIDLIIEQGEGAPIDHERSHYARFLQILDELEVIPGPFEPARPVVSNPVLDGPGTVITHPAARAVMAAFDAAYEAMLLALTRLFAHTDESDSELAVLRSVAFFPLMTMAVRPLAETLTAMPAHDPPDGSCAGASFRPGALPILPHRAAAWTVLGERLRASAELAHTAARTPGVPARLGYIARSLDLVVGRFAAGMGITC